ncbi:MAG: GNAT family N-acetyltransferase [Nitrososphaerales archaeon]
MASENRWSRFEDNENSWFSLWSEARDTGCALLLLNENLADDPVFNHATRVRCEPQEADDLIGRTISQFREKSIPPCFYVSPFTSPEDFGERLGDKGFREWDRMDVMEYVGGEPPSYEGDLEIHRVGLESMKIWTSVFTESFEIPLSQAQEYVKRSRHLFPRSDTDFILTYVDGKVAGCAALYSKNRVGGVYSLGILAEFRRMGVASNMLKAAVRLSEERHNDTLILQALRQDGLEEFYSRNSFEKAYTKSIYILR